MLATRQTPDAVSLVVVATMRPWRRVLRVSVLVHRWLGIFLCLMMTAWFASGIVMMYTSFPLIPASELYGRTPPVDARRITISPSELIRRHALEPQAIRLYTVDGRPRYAVREAGLDGCFFADTGDVCPATDEKTAAARIEHHTGMTVAGVSKPFSHDQWTVYEAFNARRPYLRIRLSDTRATDYYVSVSTGEIVQKTQRQERFWNTLGAVVHWIYPTFIRKHWALWDKLVWWLSLGGIIVVILGLVLGIVRFQHARQTQKLSLFQGWLKWHHLTGLVAGVFVLTWIVSGWLSMDHGRLFSSPSASAEQLARFDGLSPAEAAISFDLEALGTLPSFHDAHFHGFAGEALINTRTGNKQTHWRLQDRKLVEYRTSPDRLLAAVARAWPDAEPVSIAPVPDDDVYTQLREGKLGDQVMRIELATPERLWVHVDSASLSIVNVMDDSRRAYRWWYNGLHSLDIPGLVERRPLWDIVMLTLLSAGLFVCISSVVIGVKRLRQ